MRKITAWAVVGKNGKLWIDKCTGLTRDQYRIYDSRKAAEETMVNETDRVEKVVIEVAG